MKGVSGKTELSSDGIVHQTAAKIQDMTAFLPDYSFKGGDKSTTDAATSTAGLIGGGIILALAGTAGTIISYAKKKVKCQN